MLFDTFGSLFRKWPPKVFIFDRFYKGFHKAFSISAKCRFRSAPRLYPGSLLSNGRALAAARAALTGFGHSGVGQLRHTAFSRSLPANGRGMMQEGMIALNHKVRNNSPSQLFWLFPLSPKVLQPCPRGIHANHNIVLIS